MTRLVSVALEAQKPMAAGDDLMTPPWLVEAVTKVAPIGLDPCSGPNKLGRVNLTEVENGLGPQRWYTMIERDECIFVNPPYSRGHLAMWMQRVVQEGPMRTTFALVPSKTSEGWFQDYVFPCAQAVCFLRGRVKFWDPVTVKPTRGSGWFGSVVAFWDGGDPEAAGRFGAVFSNLGRVVHLA